jgi:hypothetical protein
MKKKQVIDIKKNNLILTDKLKVAVVGSREFHNFNYLSDAILSIIDPLNIGLIVSGGARGADLNGEKFAKEHNIPVKIFRANDGSGSALAKRNIKIINHCDICIAFPTKNSKGTRHDIQLCKKFKKPCFVFEV